MMYVSRRRLLQLGLLTPLAVSPLYKQSSAFAACQDGACSNPSEDRANRPTGPIAPIDNFIWPIAGAPNSPYLIGDAFGPRLIGGKYDWHEGIDIKAKEGTKVIASNSGFVRISTDCRKGYENCGKMIQIEGYDSNNQKYRINYCHLSERLVERGTIIDQGKLIGKSGCTGATWPHLHLEIRKGKDDNSQNPYFYLACPSTGSHTVAIQDITRNANGTLKVTLRVISPRNKLDINRISVSALDTTSKLQDSMYVDFNKRHNCGSVSLTNDKSYTYKESSEKAVTITPENFGYNVKKFKNWIVDFAFSGLSASNATQVKAEARDCSDRVAQDIKPI